jgi:hypothetical protein
MLTSCLSHSVVAYLGEINYMIFRYAEIFLIFNFRKEHIFVKEDEKSFGKFSSMIIRQTCAEAAPAQEWCAIWSVCVCVPFC